MKKEKILPSLRITNKTNSNIKSAIEVLNKTSLIQIGQNDFIRIALEYFSQLVLSGKELDLKIS